MGFQNIKQIDQSSNSFDLSKFKDLIKVNLTIFDHLSYSILD